MYFPRRGVIDLPSRQINDFFTKTKQKKIELVSRPATNQLPPPAPPDKPLPLRPIESQCVINIAGNKFLVVPHPTATNQNNATNQTAAKKVKGKTTFYFCFISWLYSFEHLTVLVQYDLFIRKLSWLPQLSSVFTKCFAWNKRHVSCEIVPLPWKDVGGSIDR